MTQPCFFINGETTEMCVLSRRLVRLYTLAGIQEQLGGQPELSLAFHTDSQPDSKWL